MSAHDVDLMSVVATCAAWGVFGVVWIVGAYDGASKGPNVTRHSFFGSGGVYIAACGVALFKIYTSWPSTELPAVHIAGVIVVAAGCAFCVWARPSLGLMWSAVPEVKESHELRTSGPDAWVRHPIYTGMLCMFVGTGLLAGIRDWIVLVLIAVVFELKLRVEETFMAETFPATYPAYRRRVPQFVPYRIPRRWGES
jgi:protein-S-isoprenylcysteine O-methyltransferase Ste14